MIYAEYCGDLGFDIWLHFKVIAENGSYLT